MNDMRDVNSVDPFPDEMQIHAYVDGQLGDADRKRMERWLDRHPDPSQGNPSVPLMAISGVRRAIEPWARR